jgi:hypothetical protein
MKWEEPRYNEHRLVRDDGLILATIRVNSWSYACAVHVGTKYIGDYSQLDLARAAAEKLCAGRSAP